jgi:hypothetical protein
MSTIFSISSSKFGQHLVTFTLLSITGHVSISFQIPRPQSRLGALPEYRYLTLQVFTTRFASHGGRNFASHLSFDFLTEDSDAGRHDDGQAY